MIQGNADIEGRKTLDRVWKPYVYSGKLRACGTIVPRVPVNKSEQRAIAEILCDMDAKIATLELRRQKIRTLKQGTMQQLLTGRIRLAKADSLTQSNRKS